MLGLYVFSTGAGRFVISHPLAVTHENGAGCAVPVWLQNLLSMHSAW